MTMPTLAPATVPIPPCARLASVCAAIEGRAVTCPAATRLRCATLAALYRHVPAEQERSAG
jgi:hypothetical protein